MNDSKPAVHALGDAALLVELGQRMDTALNSRAIAVARALRTCRGVREAVPAYCNVTVLYDPERTSLPALTRAVQRLTENRPEAARPGRLHRVPVVYDGPDLEPVAKALELAIDTLIGLHIEPTYRCFAVGSMPGWACLGPLPEQLRLAGREAPRTTVPAGAVAIAGSQTGVYPLSTGGSWHLIGRTSVPMFVPEANPPGLLRVGDRVRFFPVREKELPDYAQRM
jgi:KipI family sensor histidine kinase inhibitor